MNANGFTLEICANGYQSAEAAFLGGAHRIELCNNMHEGGTTPSVGLVKKCLSDFNIPIFPIIRPRGGNFIYNTQEVDIMCVDIAAFKKLGCKGVVIGCLNRHNKIHESHCKALIGAADGMEISFHRAFDRTDHLPSALPTLIAFGIKRILTSGGAKTAQEGVKTIAQLIKIADNSIEIMPGSGINNNNIVRIHRVTGAKIFHTTAKKLIKSASQNPTNLTDDLEITDLYKVKELIHTISNIQS